MSIVSDSVIYSVIREAHMMHNDFFLRYLDFVDLPRPADLTLSCFARGQLCYEIQLPGASDTERPKLADTGKVA